MQHCLRRIIYALALVAIPGLFCINSAHADNSLSVEILDEEFSLTRFTADGEHLVLWVTPGFGSEVRAHNVARSLAQKGIEVWSVNVLENLFIPVSVNSLRSLDGRYISALISEAHRQSGKQVTLMTRSYGALPVLRAARLWQMQGENDNPSSYLSGAILISPELYSEIPPLGQPPVYDPVASATNIPIMLYQGDKRGNRWQLDTTLEKLQAGGAPVHLKIMPGVTGLFYEEDIASETFDMLRKMPAEIARSLPILAKTPTPVTAAPIADIQQPLQKNLDLSLQPFKGQMSPLAIDLMSVNGKPFKRKSYDGKVTVINFWASWCGPCVEEIPALNRLRQSMLGKPFELISINYAEKPEQILEFMQMVDVDFPVLVDLDGQFSSNWNVLVYPATFVIGPDSRIAYGVNGAIEWDSPDVINQLNALLPGAQ